MPNFDKLKLKRRIQDEPQEKIKRLQGEATNAVKKLMGQEVSLEGESIREPRMLVGPDVEAEPGFRMRQQEKFDEAARAYAKRGMPMVQEEMSPMEEAEMKRQQLEEFMKRQNRGPKGL